MSRSLGLTSEARASIFAPLIGPGRSEQVEQRMREAILLGLIQDGERLPRETVLARQFGVAVSTVREALDGLRSQGLVRTTRGRDGGSFVTATAAEHRDLVSERLRSLSRAQLHDLAAHCGAIAGAAAALAAERASLEDHNNLTALVDSINVDDELSVRRGEALLRVEIAAAAQSPRLVAEELQLQSEFGPLLWFGMTAPDCRRDTINAQRATIAAIVERDSDRARVIVTEHLTALVTAVIRLSETGAAGGDTETDLARRAAGMPEPDVAVDTEPDSTVATAKLGGISVAVDYVSAAFAEVFSRVGIARTELTERLAAIAPLTSETVDAQVQTSALTELNDYAGLVVGAGFVAAPGLLVDTRWHLSWWVAPATDTRGKVQPARQLTIVEDQESEFFRDYTRLEWWRGATDGSPRHVTGPYVDYLCTDEFILTLTMPVVVDGTLLGVAGADVSVAALEKRFLPGLNRLGVRVSIVNADDRVVLSSDPALAPGSVLRDIRAEHALTGVPLRLVEH
jgi:DNA-binding FadR family transcriptional regulator